MEMLVELIITGTVGVLLIYVGLVIWKKEKISLIHSYHYKKVKEEDKKAYTALVGKGILIMGLGIILAGIMGYFTQTSYKWLCLGLFFIMGFTLIGKAQRQFNRGFF